MAQGLGPGLKGWFAADEAARQQNASQLQQLQGILGIQGMLQKQQQAKAYESELGALGPNPDQGALSSLMMKYGGPQAALHSLDRSAAREVANTNAAAMREQRLHELEIRGQQRADEITARAAEGRITQQQAAAERAALSENMARLVASLRPPVAPTVTEVADPADPTKSIKIDARTGAKIGDAPPKPKPERAVPSPLQKQLTEGAELADATKRFATTFKDDFAGKTITGELGNTYGKIMGDDTGQTQWWQDYELHQSQIRNKLFGSALTAPEIEAWNKSAINPRMDAKQVKANLTRRNMLEQRGIDRLMKGAIAGGYNREQIEAFTGRSTTTDTTTQPKQPQDPLGIR